MYKKIFTSILSIWDLTDKCIEFSKLISMLFSLFIYDKLSSTSDILNYKKSLILYKYNLLLNINNYIKFLIYIL